MIRRKINKLIKDDEWILKHTLLNELNIRFEQDMLKQCINKTWNNR